MYCVGMLYEVVRCAWVCRGVIYHSVMLCDIL